MKTIMMAMAVLVVLAVGVKLSDAVMCYSCASVWGAYTNGNCNPPDVNALKITCNQTCLSTLGMGTTNRGCGDMSQDSCSGIGSLSVCTYHCTTDYCNTKVNTSAAPRSLTTPLFVAIVTLAACVLSKLA